MKTFAIIENSPIASLGISISLKKIYESALVHIFQQGTAVLSQLDWINYDLFIIEPETILNKESNTIKRILEKQPNAKIVLYAAKESCYLIHQYKSWGLSGYISKSCSIETFIASINEILMGEKCFFVSKESRIDNSYEINPLQKREIEMAHLLRCGVSIKQISSQLNIHYSTAVKCKKRIFKKTNSSNIRQFIDYFDNHFMTLY